MQLTQFIATPALKQHSTLASVFLTGLFFGLIAYGTYDLTNHATLKNWPVIATVVDIAWGAIVSGTVSMIVVSLLRMKG